MKVMYKVMRILRKELSGLHVLSDMETSDLHVSIRHVDGAALKPSLSREATEDRLRTIMVETTAKAKAKAKAYSLALSQSGKVKENKPEFPST